MEQQGTCVWRTLIMATRPLANNGKLHVGRTNMIPKNIYLIIMRKYI